MTMPSDFGKSGNALLLGCGSKLGLEILKLQVEEYNHIDLITSSNVEMDKVNTIKVDWDNLSEADVRNIIAEHLVGKKYDFIWFNQSNFQIPNNGAFYEYIQPIDNWVHGHWINCILPYFLIRELDECLTETTKIGWTLSSGIQPAADATHSLGGYNSCKVTNYNIMRAFAKVHRSLFFGINPVSLVEESYELDAYLMDLLFKKMDREFQGVVANKGGDIWIQPITNS